MGPVSALVLFAVVWAMVFFIVLPLRLKTQGEAGEIVPGTHASSPADFKLGKKAKLTTWWALGIWAILVVIIVFEIITVRDFDVMNRLG